jgi:outer membrane beta-barrel protein
VAPTVGFTLLDEYRRTILPGARVQYNIRDWLAVGIWGGVGAASITTDLTDQIESQYNTTAPDARTRVNIKHGPGNQTANFSDQTAKMSWVAAPQVQLVPFRGKLSLFQKVFVDADAYIHLGLALVGLQERGDCGGGGQPDCTDPASFDLKSRVAIAPTFGLGLNFYANKFVSVGVEYRALPFSWNRAGFDSRGSGNDNKFPDLKVDSEDRTFKFNQMIVLAVGFSFPTEPKTSD